MRITTAKKTTRKVGENTLFPEVCRSLSVSIVWLTRVRHPALASSDIRRLSTRAGVAAEAAVGLDRLLGLVQALPVAITGVSTGTSTRPARMRVFIGIGPCGGDGDT
jgi:hypothetical protein